MLDAVLLDWEGVLVDTSAARHESRARALEESGLRADDPRDDTANELLALRASRLFAERFGKGFSLRPGARELMEGLQASVRVAIVTRASRSETEFFLGLADIRSAVSIIVSADDDVAAPLAANALRRGLDHLARLRALPPEGALLLATDADMIRAGRDIGLCSVAAAAPAHVAIEADGALASLVGVQVEDLARLHAAAHSERGA